MNTLELEICIDLVRMRKYSPEDIGTLLQARRACIIPLELAKMCQEAYIRRGKTVQIAETFITVASTIEPFAIGFANVYLGMSKYAIITLFRRYLSGEKRTIAIRTIEKMERLA
ncbi:MAG: hypothetical protein ABII02_04805 [Candidatus Magasanikbacteria bacterium]